MITPIGKRVCPRCRACHEDTEAVLVGSGNGTVPEPERQVEP